MEILFAMIAIPVLALLMMYVNGQRRHGLDRQSRDMHRKILGYLGIVVILHALLFAFWAISPLIEIFANNQQFTLPDSIAFVLRSILIGFLLFGGYAAIKVSRHDERDDLELHQQAIRERDAETFRVGLFSLVCLPLLVPGSFALILISMFAAMGFAYVAITESARRNRLLWTLALAAKHDLRFTEELESLLLSEKGKFRIDLVKLTTHLQNGTSLSQALLTNSRLLPFEYAAAIKAAEEANTLDTVLPMLAIKHTQSLKNFHVDASLNNVVMYSMFVLVVVLQVTGFIMYWIIPKYMNIFQDFGIELPEETGLLIGISDVFMNYWFLILPLLFLPFFNSLRYYLFDGRPSPEGSRLFASAFPQARYASFIANSRPRHGIQWSDSRDRAITFRLFIECRMVEPV